MARRVVVFGPAYLDRVLLVDRPLLPPGDGSPLDRSISGALTGDGADLTLVDSLGRTIHVEPPPGWPGPSGEIRLSGDLGERLTTLDWSVRGLSWHDDLGGMGAGFAAALGGRLFCALGPESDPRSGEVAELLGRHGIDHHPTRIPDRSADWTLLLTSGRFGDKLPIGFRGCHASWEETLISRLARTPCDLRIVAALPNDLARPALGADGAAVRAFAPSLGNMTGYHSNPWLSKFIDILCCNRIEWEALAAEVRGAAAATIPLVSITDGPRGARVLFRAPDGAPAEVSVPASPRDRPPRDTNRAGEAYASTLISTLLDAGWTPGPAAPELVRAAAERASAAASLVLEMERFGFPTPGEIDAALRRAGGADPDPQPPHPDPY